MLELSFSPKALSDLREIRDHIAMGDIVAAYSLLDEVSTLCEQLCRQPEMGTAIGNIRLGRRMFTFRRAYTIIYRAGSDKLEVARVLHSSRDWERLL